MALSDEINALRDRVLSDLTVTHDYYTSSKIAWILIDRKISEGYTVKIRHHTTGTVTTEKELASLAREYAGVQLAQATFQQFIALFESFYFDLLRLWLLAYPQPLRNKQIDFKSVLEAPDKEAITELVVAKEINEIVYKTPAEWFKYLEDKVNLGCPSKDEIERLAEAKATRDVLVHNRVVANLTYERKAGTRARFKDGESIDILEPYHTATWALIRKVVADVSAAARAKAS